MRVVVLVALATGCTVDTGFRSCVVRCGAAGECPSGLSCGDQGLCQVEDESCAFGAPDAPGGDGVTARDAGGADGTAASDGRVADAAGDAAAGGADAAGAGVPCAGEVCSGTYCCTATGEPQRCGSCTSCSGCLHHFYYCDGPEDCTGGEICCLDVYNVYAGCMAPATCSGPPQHYRMCHATADCPSGTCQPDPGTGQYRACQ